MSSLHRSLIVLVAALAAGQTIAARSQPGGSGGSRAAPCTPTLAPRAAGPQVSDGDFAPSVPAPAYAEGAGPKVFVDEAHHNYHTIEGRYATFAKLLRKDGFVVAPLRQAFTAQALAEVDILVIANALAAENDHQDGHWTLPTYPAFGSAEVAAVEGWVAEGGSLLLIADHMPWPGANEGLGRAFGIQMTNGFATDATCSEDEYVFATKDGSLADGPITRGRFERERIDHVRTFTGQAFWLTSPGTPLLKLEPGSVVLMPFKAWEFSQRTPTIPGDGLLQGAVLRHGKGRVAVFGEAAMFSAQVSGSERRPMGMNAPGADENPQFLLNVMHWLAGLLT